MRKVECKIKSHIKKKIHNTAKEYNKAPQLNYL